LRRILPTDADAEWAEGTRDGGRLFCVLGSAGDGL